MSKIVQKFTSSIVWNILDKLVNQIGFLFVSFYIARIIGPEAVGTTGLLMIFILLSESIVFGFSQALIHKSDELTEDDSSTVFYITLMWSTFFYSLLFVLSPYIAIFYSKPELTLVARVLFLVILINSLMVVFRAKLIIKLDFRSQAIVATCASIISAAVAIYLVNKDYSYWSIVWMILTKQFIVLFGLFFYSHWFPLWSFSFQSFLSLFKFGSYLMLASITSTFVNNLSLLLIGRYFNITQVGYYSQANNMSSQVSSLLASVLQGVTYPLMTSVKNDREQLEEIYKQLLSITVFLSLPILIGIAAVSHEIILLFLGNKWISVEPLLMALCFARAITPINGVNMNILNVLGRSDLFFKLDLIKVPISLIAICISIPFGVDVLAYSMIATSFIAFFINTYYPSKLFQLGAIQQIKLISNYVVSAMLMFFVVYNIDPFTNNLLLLLVLKILSGMVVYVLSLLILRDSLLLSYLKIIVSKCNVYEKVK